LWPSPPDGRNEDAQSGAFAPAHLDAQSGSRVRRLNMQIGRLAKPFARSVVAALMVSAAAIQASAQSHDGHGGSAASQSHKPTRQENDLVKAVRDATEQFKNVTSIDGPGQGYALAFGCVSGGDFGAMGLHYVNMGLVDGNVQVDQPEIILFEPTKDGGIRITGADYLVPVQAWKDAHPGEGPPQLFGQLFHLFESPNRFDLDTFYTLHVWAWKDNPNGTFGNWNPDVKCDGFNPPQGSKQ
jgi:hypothetical protein